MPEEIEVPTEHLHEALDEEAHKNEHEHHGHGHDGKKGGHAKHVNWVPAVALSAAVMAVCAAIAALLAGHHANEGVLDQITAADRWAEFQAKGIKSSVLTSKIELLTELQKTPKAEDVQKIADYQNDQKEILTQATGYERDSAAHMDHHNIFARTVTLFQIAIALAAISVLSRRKWLWFASLALAAGGSVFMVQAFL